uniref:Succinate dehydrogenase assembly factor 3 n=1 Tax=Blastobotrys adeninivorans TaxID=409370 RepID=A0A060T7N7_BLAAD
MAQWLNGSRGAPFRLQLWFWSGPGRWAIKMGSLTGPNYGDTMRASQVVLATRRTIKQTSPLLPPLKLYRRVLRAHVHCLKDPRARALGDDYVRNEFRLHRNLDNPVQIIAFLSSWQKYAEQLEGDNWKDQKLDMALFTNMSDDQVIQLYELMQAAKLEESVYNNTNS